MSEIPAKIEDAWQPAVWQLLLGAVLAGILGFLVINQIHPYYPLPELPELGPYPSKKLLDEHKAAELDFHRHNEAVNCGVLGGLLGLFTALFAAKRKVVSCLVSSVLGVVAGSGIGHVIGEMAANSINQSTQQSLPQSLSYHSAVFAVISLAVWGSITLINRPSRILPAVISAVVGGVLGALIYNVVCSLTFPLSNLSIITARTTTERAIWVTSCALGLAICWALGARSSKQPVVGDART